jgi:hypothetical protein
MIKFYELILQRIRDQQDQYIHRLTNGSLQNFEDYRDLSGKVFGLKQAEEIIKDVFADIQMPNKN